jgi:hypothetical protein
MTHVGLRVPIQEARRQILLDLTDLPESSGPSLCLTMSCLCHNGIPIPQECVNPARLDGVHIPQIFSKWLER